MQTQPPILIKQSEKYITVTIPVLTWERNLVTRLRQLSNQGGGMFLLCIDNESVTLQRVGKVEVVGESNGKVTG